MNNVVIVGGGPAGIVLGYLLARRGIPVTVHEKHADFNRDFRGDTIHPSTLELMYQLGLLEEFLKLPHDELHEPKVLFQNHPTQIADFSKVPTHCKFIAFMPQWEFLNFFASKANEFPSFDLRMESKVEDLIWEGEKVVGVKGSFGEQRADIVIACDGRHSIVRQKAKLPLHDFQVPIDVLWLKIPKDDPNRESYLGYFSGDNFMVLIDRRDYYQAAVLIRKGDFEPIKAQGIEAFRQRIVDTIPFLKEAVKSIESWEDVYFLEVKIERLTTWYKPGLLCIGDAAHAMSPAGGVGINYAIQDAIATANILLDSLLAGTVKTEDLAKVQTRREPPTRSVQNFQINFHKRVVNAQGTSPLTSFLFWIVRHSRPVRQRIASFMGIGPLPEHLDKV